VTQNTISEQNTIPDETPKKGGILDALRRSPLVGADLDLVRPVTHGRKVDPPTAR
jgi:hypothetical protein